MNILSLSALLLIAILNTTAVSETANTNKKSCETPSHISTTKSDASISSMIYKLELQISTKVNASIDATNLKLQANISEMSAALNDYLGSFLINK